jgi:alpha-methylacyl-CoA racemase
VLDVAMIDGVGSMLTAFHAMRAHGDWSDQREDNLVDGGAPWYRCYATSDGGYVAVGALEPRFYGDFIERLELAPERWPMYQRDEWPRQRAELERLFLTKPRAYWEELFAGADACVTPVLSLEESAQHPHARARASFTRFNGSLVPEAAPRFSRSAPRVAGPAPPPGAQTDAVLAELGISRPTLAELRSAGVIG